MRRTRAVVVGGSIAGLSAARALQPTFDEVVLVERDALPRGAAERAGAPQARHVHALLARGWLELERLFPGFQARMRAEGVEELDPGVDFATLRPTGWQSRMPVGHGIFFMTRDRTESILRALAREAGVTLRERTEVTGLLSAQGGRRVAGVATRARDGGAADAIEADLVVDAGGRSSKAPAWLAALGVPAPAETLVDSFAGYSSRWFQQPPKDKRPGSWWWRALWLEPAPPADLCGGVLFPVEQDRWIITLYGYSRRYPPADEEGFTRAAGALRSGVLAEAVANAEPLSPVFTSRKLGNRFRHYERVAQAPDGFTALGDSVCVFNPIYGQGMTVAAVCAAALRDTARALGPRHHGLGQAFFQTQARLFAAPWALACGADLRYPATEGDPPPIARIVQHYTEAMADVGRRDAVVARVSMEVYSMLKPSSLLLHPGFLARVAAGALRHALERRAGRGAYPSMPPT